MADEKGINFDEIKKDVEAKAGEAKEAISEKVEEVEKDVVDKAKKGIEDAVKGITDKKDQQA